MALEGLNQAAWTFMQDWVNRRNQQYSLDNMVKQQEGWSKYQQEGADLELKRIADQLQGQKEAAVFMKYLGLADEDVPKMLQMMQILAPLGKSVGAPIPEGITGMAPELTGKANILSEAIPKILAGSFEGLDYPNIIPAAGGMQNLIRMLEQGGGRINLTDQLPGQRLNAAANLLGARGKGETTGAKVDSNLFTVIKDTKADIDRITAKFMPITSGSGATTEMVMQAVMSAMPELAAGRNAKDATEDARKWVLDVGLEFFDDLSGMLNEIYIRGAQGEITNQELMIVRDAASPYKMSITFARVKKQVMDDLAKDYPGRDLTKLFETDKEFRRSVLDTTWQKMYGQ